MKVLIVMLESQTGWHLEATYSIGTAAVSAYVKQMGHKLIYLNLNKNKDSEQSCAGRIYDYVKSEGPEVVIVGGLVTDWKKIKEVCDIAKAGNPNIIVIIGGGFVSYSHYEAMALIGVADYGVIGEGEVTTHELLTALKSNQPVEDIDGLIYKNCLGDFVVTKKRKAFMDLDVLPFLDYEGFSLFDEISKTKSFAISTSRSCPFGCTYCTHSGGGGYRQRSLESVFQEIDYVIKNVPNVKVLSICDELFSADKIRFDKFIDRIAPYKLEWFLPMRADSIKDPEIFKKAYNAGCKEMQVGLESGCDTILKSMRKGTTTTILKDFYRNADTSDITITSSLIFGDVAETIETVEKSFAFAEELQSINAKTRINFDSIKLYPGSPLYDDAKASGKISDTTKHILDGIPLVNISKISDSEYNFLVKRTIPAKRILYLNRIAIGRQKLFDYKRRIIQDRFLRSYTYLNFFDVDKKNCVYKTNYICPKCSEFYYQDFDILTYELGFNFSFLCPTCQSEHHIENKIHAALVLNENFFETIKPALKDMLEIGHVGISGMGVFFARYRVEFGQIFDELESLSKNRFILSDKSHDIANKSTVIGRKIYKTESILDKVKNIIVPNAYSPQIREMAHSKNPEIRIGVFCLFELPFLGCQQVKP